MERLFKKIDNELRTATDPSQIGTPHARLAVIISEEDWMRAIYRAYELGKADRSAEIRSLIG